MTIPTIALLGLAFGYLGAVGLAQTPGAGASPPSALGEVDTYVKIVGTAFTAVATLIGLPIVRLTYRKTRAEIAKLELEAAEANISEKCVTRFA